MQFSLVLLLISAISQLGTGANIHVDRQHGISNTSCCPSSSEKSVSPCMTLTLALECVQNLPLTTSVSLILNEGEYSLTNDSRLTVIRERTGGFTITGNCSTTGSCVEIDCEEGAGLTFIKSDEITLENLAFARCGFPNNSTSKLDNNFEIVTSTLYFLLCRTVTISYVTVQETEGTGVVMYSTVGINTIANSNFISNKPPTMNDSDAVTGGGGLYVEFAFCYPGNVSCFSGQTNIPEEYTKNSTYIISDCVFYDNVADVNDTSQFTIILPQKSNHLAFGRGGGLSLFFKGYATNNSVTIEGSEFTKNKALWGAGLFVEMQDWSCNNSVAVSNSEFHNNQCLQKKSSSTGGGGVRVGYIFFEDTHVKWNNMKFENCNYSSNFAFFGGGVSFYASREPTETISTNSLVFLNTTWQENVARAGSGADLSVWHGEYKGAVAVVNFTNCHFIDNNGSYTEEQSTAVGIGALYLDSVPVYFMGENYFFGNTHSALAAITTVIYTMNNSSLTFINNTGRHGGAVALLGAAFIQTYPYSRLTFINNSATIDGGAIYQRSIGEHDLINSRNCFIQYSNILVTPDKWKSSFFFSGNIANDHNESIFASSLQICEWGGAFGDSSDNLLEVFCWSDNWDYDGGNCTTEVRTSPARYTSRSNFVVELFPGKRRPMKLIMWDDRGNDVTSSSAFHALSLTEGIQIDPSSQYISGNRIQVHTGKSKDNREVNGSVLIETTEPRVVQAIVNISVFPCPPGMVLMGDNETGSCTCGGNFEGIITCNFTGFYTEIRRGNWIGFYSLNNIEKIVAGRTPYFQSGSNNLFLKLPIKLDKLDGFLCGKINRKGTLCGECVDGYGPSIHTLDCIPCDANYMWALYLLSQYLPLTLLFAVVCIFDIRVASAPANAFIFVAQVLPTVFKLNGGGAITLNHTSNILVNTYTFLYNIWNLQFFSLNICLSPHLSSLGAISISYLEAVYPLFLIGIVSFFVWLYGKGFQCILCIFRPLHTLLAHFQHHWNIQRSLMHTFASFILLSYSRFILVSFLLLTTTPLVTDSGDVFIRVVFYDGTIPFLSPGHAIFVLFSSLLLLLFAIVTPLLLIIPSVCRNLTIARRRWPRVGKFFPSVHCSLSCPKLKAFLEIFHGCYRDGTNTAKGSAEFDYRWFAGFYLILRVALFATYAFASDWFEQYCLLQIFCILGLLALVLLHPYKDNFYNKLDASMFAILLGINTFTMYNYGTTVISSKPSVVAFGVQYVLVFLPLIYISVVVIQHIYNCLCKGCSHSLTIGDCDPKQQQLVGCDHEEGDDNFLALTNERQKETIVYRPAHGVYNSEESTSIHCSTRAFSSPARYEYQHISGKQSNETPLCTPNDNRVSTGERLRERKPLI